MALEASPTPSESGDTAGDPHTRAGRNYLNAQKSLKCFRKFCCTSRLKSDEAWDLIPKENTPNPRMKLYQLHAKGLHRNRPLEGCQGRRLCNTQEGFGKSFSKLVWPSAPRSATAELQTEPGTGWSTGQPWPPGLHFTFLFDQVLQRLPLDVEGDVGDEGSVPLGGVGVGLEAVPSPLHPLLLLLLIRGRSLTFTARERIPHVNSWGWSRATASRWSKTRTRNH